jgi:CDP-glycerol glycerophosphotransferase
MKHNLNKYNSKRAKMLIKGFFPSIIGYFVPKKKKRIIFTSNRNEMYAYNSKYLFEYFIKHYPELEIKFVMNDAEKRERLNNIFGIQNNYFIETESFKGMWYALRAKTWIISAYETPVMGIFLKINRFVFHLGHSAYFRSAMFLEGNPPWYKKLYFHIIKNNFSKHLITSHEIAKVIPKMVGCKKKDIVVMGEPMNDRIFNPDHEMFVRLFGEKVLDSHNILYAPTWRPRGTLKLFPFNDMDWLDFVQFLEAENINIFLRTHPAFEEDLSFYTDKSKRIKIANGDLIEDINDIITLFDIIISDYSSVFTGYLMSRKKVMFLPYDLEEYEKNTGFVLPYHDATPGPKPTSYIDFKKEIIVLLKNKTYYANEIEKASFLFNSYQEGDNAKRLADYILKEIGYKQ